MFVGYMAAIKRSKATKKAITVKIPFIGGLAMMLLFKAFKEMAYANDLHRGDLEVLFTIWEMSELNEKRLGSAQTTAPELCVVTGKHNREIMRIIHRLMERGYVLNNGRSVLWQWLPFAYSLSRAGVLLLKQYGENIEAEERRINSIHKSREVKVK